MKVEKFYCDAEGCKNERMSNFHAYLKSTRDASGNGSDHWYAVFDLCAAHAAQLFQAMLEAHYEPATRKTIPASAADLLRANNIKWEER
jgi:hypothetical protein